MDVPGPERGKKKGGKEKACGVVRRVKQVRENLALAGFREFWRKERGARSSGFQT